MNIDASPWTRMIGLPGSNHRGPGRWWIRSRARSPSGPATRSKSAAPRLVRTLSRSAMLRAYVGAFTRAVGVPSLAPTVVGRRSHGEDRATPRAPRARATDARAGPARPEVRSGRRPAPACEAPAPPGSSVDRRPRLADLPRSRHGRDERRAGADARPAPSPAAPPGPAHHRGHRHVGPWRVRLRAHPTRHEHAGQL